MEKSATLSEFNTRLHETRERILSSDTAPESNALDEGFAGTIEQSWLRCARLGLSPDEVIEYSGGALSEDASRKEPSPSASPASPAFPPSRTVLAPSHLLKELGKVVGTAPFAAFLLDQDATVLDFHCDYDSGYAESVSDSLLGLVSFDALLEHRCGTLACHVIDDGRPSATLIGAQHYLDCFSACISSATLVPIGEPGISWRILVVMQLDDAGTIDDSLLGRIEAALTVASEAVSAGYKAKRTELQSLFFQELLKNSIAFSHEALAVATVGGLVLNMNAKARAMLDLPARESDTPTIRIKLANRDLKMTLQAGRLVSGLKLTFILDEREQAFFCDIRPLLDHANKAVIGSTIRLREPGSSDDSAIPGLRLETLVGTSRSFCEAKRLAMLAAGTRESILIAGEVGCGKKTLARAMHLSSHDDLETFALVRCRDISEEELRAEIFGAVIDCTGEVLEGAIWKANGGTLVIDDIDRLPPSLQSALLNVLESRSARRPGRAREESVSIKLIALTEFEDLGKLVEDGVFRPALYYRFTGVQIYLPSLRERTEDIVALANHFISGFCEENSIPPITCTGGVTKLLRRYDWPGNVQQLKFLIRHACYVCRNRVIDAACLPASIADSSDSYSQEADVFADESQSIKAARRSQLVNALQLSGGNAAKAARILGISRSTLYRWKQEEGLV